MKYPATILILVLALAAGAQTLQPPANRSQVTNMVANGYYVSPSGLGDFYNFVLIPYVAANAGGNTNALTAAQSAVLNASVTNIVEGTNNSVTSHTLTLNTNYLTTNTIARFIFSVDTNGFLIDSNTLYNRAVQSSGSTLVLQTNASFTFGATNRLFLGLVPSVQSASYIAAGYNSFDPNNTNSVPSLPGVAPILQFSDDGVTWYDATNGIAHAVLVSFYASDTNGTASNATVYAYANPFVVGSTNDLRGQSLLVDMTTNDSSVVNVGGAKNIAATEASKWANYPATTRVDLNAQGITLSPIWTLTSRGASLKFRGNGMDFLSLMPNNIIGGTNALISSITVTTNLTIAVVANTAPVIQWTTNLSTPSWQNLPQTTNYQSGPLWYVIADKPAADLAYFRAYAGSVIGFSTMKVNGGIILTNQTIAPTADLVSGDTLNTNFMLATVSNQFMLYWSDGSNLFSKSISGLNGVTAAQAQIISMALTNPAAFDAAGAAQAATNNLPAKIWTLGNLSQSNIITSNNIVSVHPSQIYPAITTQSQWPLSAITNAGNLAGSNNITQANIVGGIDASNLNSGYLSMGRLTQSGTNLQGAVLVVDTNDASGRSYSTNLIGINTTGNAATATSAIFSTTAQSSTYSTFAQSATNYLGTSLTISGTNGANYGILTNIQNALAGELDIRVAGTSGTNTVLQMFSTGNVTLTQPNSLLTAGSYATINGTNFAVATNGNGIIGGVAVTNSVIKVSSGGGFMGLASGSPATGFDIDCFNIKSANNVYSGSSGGIGVFNQWRFMDGGQSSPNVGAGNAALCNWGSSVINTLVSSNFTALGVMKSTNGFTMPPIASYAGPICTNGLAHQWNSNGVVLLRYSSVGATTWSEKQLAP